ncbi:hypothetical protein RSJ21_11225 [Clostridium botulinum]|nr:hypothetical protein RSJ14_11070 [Clostridium botulinum]AUN21931.1 hypothetical protein RSJ22_10995 [Clostridium botulinum]AUN25784.1 hypothetical protein RSJ21_11225 [Clostridium botulinum]MBN3364523.1 hypothetical protein [Clostridium botulinum]MBN3376095.1 hypothetical protein [Clostridium botulinum]
MSIDLDNLATITFLFLSFLLDIIYQYFVHYKKYDIIKNNILAKQTPHTECVTRIERVKG